MSMDDRYQNWQHLGDGGTATVWRAMDHRLGYEVAIKLLQGQFADEPIFLDTLKREVLTSRQLRHPNIAAIHDFYEGEHGVGVVMDIISGAYELADWQKANQGKLLSTVGQRLQVLKLIFQALTLAHTRIIHRDLKPGNIMLVDGDIANPVIMDFGFALPPSDVEDAFQVGTPKYMSPEQWERPTEVDKRSDLFSMGVIAYQLFTDRIPPTSLQATPRTGEIPRPDPSTIVRPSAFCSAIPSSLDELIIRLMAFDPNDRPQSAEQVLEVLDRVTLSSGEVIESEDQKNAAQTDAIAIPSGLFQLGSGPESRNKAEKPRRQIEIAAFKLARYPVTNTEYKQFVMQTGYDHPPLLDHPIFGQPQHPVVGVNWEDASNYARWVGGRLPSEAEWEYAAKGGKEQAFPWGSQPPENVHANIGGLQEATTAVGSYPLGDSNFDIAEMCGNVWEWCADVWDEGYYGRITNGSINPVNTISASHRERTVRGGAYDSFGPMGRCAFRFHFPEATHNPALGFRIAFTLDTADTDPK